MDIGGPFTFLYRESLPKLGPTLQLKHKSLWRLEPSLK